MKRRTVSIVSCAINTQGLKEGKDTERNGACTSAFGHSCHKGDVLNSVLALCVCVRLCFGLRPQGHRFEFEWPHIQS